MSSHILFRLCVLFACLILLLLQCQVPVLAEAETAGKAEEVVAPPVSVDLLTIGSPRLVLKNGNSLVVLDKSGMIDSRPGSPYGLYQDDTRYLSRWEMRVNDKEATLLNAQTDSGYKGKFLYNVDDVLLERELVVADGIAERLRVHNYADKRVNLKLSILHGCDFKDMFEVRGQKRKKTGQHVAVDEKLMQQSDKIVLQDRYLGLDKQGYITYLSLGKSLNPKVSSGRVDYALSLSPRAESTIEFRVDTSHDLHPRLSGMPDPLWYQETLETADREYTSWETSSPQFKVDWSLLNDMILQSQRDLYLLRQDTPKGPCLAAGLPWYSCAFGRDQCITALQTLPFYPQLAKDVLKVLAAYQGKKHDSFTEEDAGRIMHELRLGEMAHVKEIPFIPYYGTVDATPLWLMLLSRYIDATGDLDVARELWSNVESALSYIDKGVSKDNGFLYYGGKEGAALSNQAWKDSADSIMHKDGKLATAPLAVCEVQGYLYEAYTGAAKLAARLGKTVKSSELEAKANVLKESFRKSFWLPEQKFVALAVDATAQPCDVVSSNPGHLLNSGLVDDEMANAIVDRLMKDDMYSGWGIRTLSSKEVRYNPLSYHDGSVWPHDNAMIVEGMAAHGRMKEACTVMESLVQSSKTASDARLPELFCGFSRNEFSTPVPYSVSCVPQAWAAGSLFQMLKSILGIKLVDKQIKVDHPLLPASINHLTVTGLGVDKSTLKFDRDPATGQVGVTQSK